MMDCITEPQCSQYPVFVGAKVATYGKDQAVAIGKYATLMVVQNGVLVGTVKNSSKEEMRVTLGDKAFSGLKKGFLAKEYKDVSLYWFHSVVENKHCSNRSVTTAKRKQGEYAFILTYTLDNVVFSKFTAMLKGLKVDPNKNTEILSVRQIKDVINKRLEEVMPVFLDTCPLCHFNLPGRNAPRPTMVLNELAKVAELFGLSGKIDIIGV